MSSSPIRIVLVDDHKIVRDSWRIVLENNPQFSVIADCDNGHDAIRHAEVHNPDIMIVDINMSPVNGFDVTETVVRNNPHIKVIALSVNNQPRYADRMMALGAKGYLTKTSSLEEINHGIMEVFRGATYICQEIRQNMNGTADE
jgi:DNA-binding NarL/FixJ family response regulator